MDPAGGAIWYLLRLRGTRRHALPVNPQVSARFPFLRLFLDVPVWNKQSLLCYILYLFGFWSPANTKSWIVCCLGLYGMWVDPRQFVCVWNSEESVCFLKVKKTSWPVSAFFPKRKAPYCSVGKPRRVLFQFGTSMSLTAILRLFCWGLGQTSFCQDNLWRSAFFVWTHSKAKPWKPWVEFCYSSQRYSGPRWIRISSLSPFGANYAGIELWRSFICHERQKIFFGDLFELRGVSKQADSN